MLSGFKTLFARADILLLDARFNAEELAAWKVPVLSFLKRASTATSTTCPGCEQSCTIGVEQHPITRQSFIFCDKNDHIGRVPVIAHLLERWRMDIAALAETLAQSIRGRTRQCVEDRLYLLGTLDDRPLLLACGLQTRPGLTHTYLDNPNSIVLSLAATLCGDMTAIVALADVIELKDDLLGLDLNLLRALLPVPTHGDAYSFRRDGDSWQLMFKGKQASVKNGKGMEYLHQLIMRPHTEINAMTMAHPHGVAGHSQDEDLNSDHVSQPVLDQDTLRSLQINLSELKITNPHSPQIPELETFITRSTFKNKPKKFADGQEKARVSVRQAIQRALSTLDKHLPEMSEHLRASLRTGILCCYAPQKIIPWR